MAIRSAVVPLSAKLWLCEAGALVLVALVAGLVWDSERSQLVELVCRLDPKVPRRFPTQPSDCLDESHRLETVAGWTSVVALTLAAIALLFAVRKVYAARRRW